MRFEFATASRTLFGPGVWREVAPLAKEWGRRALVVTGRSTERANPLLKSLADHGRACATFVIPGEPTTDGVAAGVQAGRRERSDLIIGVGGGSAIDAAKAIAALLTNPGVLQDYLEVIGRGQQLTQPALPCIAVPTTAGTGAGGARNAGLASPAHGVEGKRRSPGLLPQL